MSNSSGRHTLSNCTAHHLNGLALEPTEWMVVWLDEQDEQRRGFVKTGAEQHTLEKVSTGLACFTSGSSRGAAGSES